LRQNLQQVAPNQEKPHTTPLHSLIYSIYISVGSWDVGEEIQSTGEWTLALCNSLQL
jgi:hypothetical protein